MKSPGTHRHAVFSVPPGNQQRRYRTTVQLREYTSVQRRTATLEAGKIFRSYMISITKSGIQSFTLQCALRRCVAYSRAGSPQSAI